MSMEDWSAYRRELRAAMTHLTDLNPDMVAAYRTLAESGGSAGPLGEKMRELIALAVAVTTRCDGCIAVHTAAALKAGATQAEMAEALGVAVAVNAGSTMVYSARVIEAARQAQAAHAG